MPRLMPEVAHDEVKKHCQCGCAPKELIFILGYCRIDALYAQKAHIERKSSQDKEEQGP